MLDSNSVVLITGATGFTGSYLLKAICGIGCEVRAICRATSDRSALSSLDITWHEGNVYDEKVIEEACQNVTHVIHLAAAYRQSGISDEVYYNVHVVSTKLLVKHALLSSKFEKFIHLSTVGVLGHIENPPADENAALNPGDVYQETKTEAESWILQAAREKNFALTIIRPAAIYGPGDRRLLKLFKMAKMPIVPIIGFSSGLYHLIHVEDLVRFIIYSANEPKTDGEVYICGSPEATSIKKMIKTIASVLNRKPIFFHIPAWPVFLLADLCEFVCGIINKEPPIYRRRVAFFTKDRSFNTNKMQQQAGFIPEIGDEEGLKKLTQWYQEHGWL